LSRTIGVIQKKKTKAKAKAKDAASVLSEKAKRREENGAGRPMDPTCQLCVGEDVPWKEDVATESFGSCSQHRFHTQCVEKVFAALEMKNRGVCPACIVRLKGCTLCTVMSSWVPSEGSLRHDEGDCHPCQGIARAHICKRKETCQDCHHLDHLPSAKVPRPSRRTRKNNFKKLQAQREEESKKAEEESKQADKGDSQEDSAEAWEDL